MEGLGKKLQEARIARNLTLEEAGRLTKIRPQRLQDIENEDFSEFASLAYAKGFLVIYGKFLGVDVSPYLEAFETSESVTVDGYAYLQQDVPAPRPVRHAPVRTSTGSGRGSFFPFVIGVVVLVVGFMAMKWIFALQRLKPSPPQMIGVPPVSTAAPETIVAPRAQPVETPIHPTPAPVVAVAPTVAPTIAPHADAQPVPSEPEVRRAEPVHPEDLQLIEPTAPPVIRRAPPRAVVPSPAPRMSPAVPRAVAPRP